MYVFAFINIIIIWVLLLHLSLVVVANVEKAVFLAPAAIQIPRTHPNLDDLLLVRSLSPSKSSLRTRVNASFPKTRDDISPKGSESWFLLEGLIPHQRYEVRICWLATQPTSFSIYPWTLPTVFETPELITSLTTYSYARHHSLAEENSDGARIHPPPPPSEPEPEHRSASSSSSNDDDSLLEYNNNKSTLFLQIFAAADYFTLNTTLMENVPPVPVDIILDPYLLNVFPKSLVPTAVYLCALAGIGWVVAGWTWRIINNILGGLELSTPPSPPMAASEHEQSDVAATRRKKDE